MTREQGDSVPGVKTKRGNFFFLFDANKDPHRLGIFKQQQARQSNDLPLFFCLPSPPRHLLCQQSKKKKKDVSFGTTHHVDSKCNDGVKSDQ